MDVGALAGRGSNRGCSVTEGCLFDMVSEYACMVAVLGSSRRSTPLGASGEDIEPGFVRSDTYPLFVGTIGVLVLLSSMRECTVDVCVVVGFVAGSAGPKTGSCLAEPFVVEWVVWSSETVDSTPYYMFVRRVSNLTSSRAVAELVSNCSICLAVE